MIIGEFSMNRSFHWYLILQILANPVQVLAYALAPKTKKLLNYAQITENYVPSVSSLFLAISVPTGLKRFKKDDLVQNAIFSLIND